MANSAKMAPAAAAELLKRRRIRRSLAEWARYRGHEPSAHWV
jgi:hypothetical protein